MMRYNIVLDDRHREIIEDYGKRHGMIATTGRKTGEVNASQVIQHALESLTMVEAIRNLKVSEGADILQHYES